MTQPDETTHCHRLASRGAVAFVLWVAMALAFAQMGVAQTTLPGLKPQPNLLDRGSSDNLFKPGGVRDILRKPPEPRVIAPTPPVTLPQVEVPEIKFPSVERTRPTLRAQDREGPLCVDGSDSCLPPTEPTRCESGALCQPGFRCSEGGGCIPRAAVDCGKGRYCAPGNMCSVDAECVPEVRPRARTDEASGSTDPLE